MRSGIDRPPGLRSGWSHLWFSGWLSVCVLLVGCGAHSSPPAPGNGNGDGGGGGSDMAACHNTSPCGPAGATQCSGERVQKCTADAKGCLNWGPSDPCPEGQICDG